MIARKRSSLAQAEFCNPQQLTPERLATEQETDSRRPRLAVFFSHPTQHHSAMFQYLAKTGQVDLRVYYYDPGSLGGMFDPGYGTDSAWDVDLITGTRSQVLANVLRGREVKPFRQLNPGVVWAVLKGRFDAILLSGYASPSNWMVLSAAWLTKSPVWYQSDTNILDVNRKVPSRLKDFLRRMFLGRVTRFLVAGDNNKAAYRHLDIHESKMVWCPIPVDMARYTEARVDSALHRKLDGLRKQYGIPRTARVVAFCGKLIERKRPQDLVEALRIMGRKNVYGLFIGSGQMESGLKRELTAEDRIVITGFVNQSEIPYHMLLAEVGVVCSEWDPHPLVTTEFAMCGRPVIVSDYCGVWGEHDILRPGENGLLYRSGDVQELAAKISKLLDNDNLRLGMGERSLVFAAEQSAEHAARIITGLLTRSRQPNQAF